MRGLFPGLPERNPGLKLANAFSVTRGDRPHETARCTKGKCSNCITTALSELYDYESKSGILIASIEKRIAVGLLTRRVSHQGFF
jgi:hypothetical protein